jgi:putative membrane protein
MHRHIILNCYILGANMNQYIEVSLQAVILFPFVVAIFTLPYIAYNYHKYGSVISLKVVIVYSFIFYILCMYCLVILPLPSPEKAATLHSHKMQLEPFLFIKDILQRSDIIKDQPKTWLSVVLNKAFLVNILNLFLALPFGMYLRYYFKRSFIETIVLSFLLSLFFEITQLTGLYFLYSGSYRLFDVDDLIVNTSGGVLGFLLMGPVMKFLPSRDELDEISYKKGMEVSLTRRFISFFFDMAFIAFLTFICEILIPEFALLFSFEASILFYFSVFPILFKGRTLGKFITSTAIVSLNEELPAFYSYFLRYILFYGFYFFIPLNIGRLLESLILTNTDPYKDMAYATVELLAAILYFMILLTALIKSARHRRLLYEKLSKTKIQSTVKVS